MKSIFYGNIFCLSDLLDKIAWKGIIKKQHLLVMKLITLLLTITCLQLRAESYAQQITLRVKNAPIAKVFEQIFEQTGYQFVATKDMLKEAHRVSISVENAPLKTVLEICFDNQPLTYILKNKAIIVKRKGVSVGQKAEILLPPPVLVTGTVTDSITGKPLTSVSIKIKGTAMGTVTDTEGRFSLEVDEDAVLIVSYLGYKSKTIAVNGRTSIHINLSAISTGLNQLVVVGYGTQKRSDITGSISSVTSEQINKTPSTSFAEMLRGAAPGVQVTTGSSAPGGRSNILIRGRRSLSGGNDPLFVVDGVPMASIDDLNANVVASIEILKDASAQSIYGARAANGVILVTTKRGTPGKTKITVNSYAGVESIHSNFKLYNGDQWAAYRKEAFYNAYGYYDETEVLGGLMKDVYESKKYIDWEDVMFSPAWQNKNDLLIQSGNEKTKYALSLGQFYQGGIVPSSEFKRFTGRLNIDQKFSDKFSVTTNISYSKSLRTIADGSFNSFITMPPLAEIYKADGSLREDVTEAGESNFNPLWNIRNSDNLIITDRLNLNLVGKWDIANNLSYKLNSSLSTRNVQENYYLGLKHTSGRNDGGRASIAKNLYTDYLVEHILTYSHDFDKNHLDGTAVASINGIQYKTTGITGMGFANDDLTYNAISSSLEQTVPVYGFSDRKLISYMGRARYNYDSKYFLTLAMRVDGSSVFGANNKYGYFPSAAFAWRANEESFLKDKEWLSNLKLRLSYGLVGNQAISPYTTLGLATKYLTEFGDKTAIGYIPSSRLTNPDLKWETTSSFNIGIDFGFLNNRINGAIDLYNTETTDLLVNKSLSTTLGYSSQLVNLGQVQNRGIELSLNTVPIRAGDFEWTVGITLSKNQNKIIKIDGEVDADGNPVNDINNEWFIGQSMNVYYDYVFDGIWQLDDDISSSPMPTAKPGDIRVKDLDGDGKITVDDRHIIQRDPDLLTSLMMSFSYKRFSLSLDVYGVVGGYLYNNYLVGFSTGGDLTGKRNGIRRNYWTVYNPSNETPAPNFIQPPAYLSSLAYEKADYLKLRNVSFSYYFPEQLISRIGINSLKLFITASNLWTWTAVQSYGPEQSPGAYPEPRTFLFGIKFSL